MRKLIFFYCLLLSTGVSAFTYPVFDKVLSNGLKVIVCEKPGGGFAEVEVWYRAGSKDESPGTRGMAHMFEHMMFRGTKNISGQRLMYMLDSVGAQWNAYTTFDRTVYHELVPANAVDMALMLEADRMNNLVVTQEILNTEREVVGQEYRNGISNWYRKMQLDRYAMLYPAGHPYEVDVIGNLDEITAFTSEQCMDFYNRFYSPNNAFVIVVGDVKHDEVFAMAEKHFSPVTKQLPLMVAGKAPEVMGTHVKGNEMSLDFPVQIYCFTAPQPAVSSKDFFAYNMLTRILFTDENSILNERLVKTDKSAFAVINTGDEWSLYSSRCQLDVVMPPAPGNVKVKKAVREEIDKVAANGLPQEKINDFISNMEAKEIMSAYYVQDIANELGMAEYYFFDHKKAGKMTEEYKAVTQDDIKRVASTYFSVETVDVINVKPE